MAALAKKTLAKITRLHNLSVRVLCVCLGGGHLGLAAFYRRTRAKNVKDLGASGRISNSVDAR